MKKRNKKNTLSKDPYDNFVIRDLQDRIISFCSKKKADWYLNRNLAEKLSDNEIKLNFETKGLGNFGDDFYIQERDNWCVVCGSKENLTRHYVVPFCFRKYFPDEIKNHSYHDILPICLDCSNKYTPFNLEFRRKLEKEFNVPVEGEIEVKGREDLIKCVSIAKTLIKHGNKIPLERRKILCNIISDTLSNFKDIPSLDEISNWNIEVKTKTQGEMLVEKMSLEEIKSFIENWRIHFVNTMNPKFLPPHWNVFRSEK